MSSLLFCLLTLAIAVGVFPPMAIYGKLWPQIYQK